MVQPAQHTFSRTASVHLWQVNLSKVAEVDVLSEDEKQRALRYRFMRHRTAFILSRVATRTLLCAYLECAAKDIRFKYGQYGKPAIESPPTEITFNLSHSDNQMLIAISRKLDLGVDIEAFSRGRHFAEAIKDNLNSSEQAYIEGAPVHLRDELLLRYWTQKEAFLKALGFGMSFPLKAVDVRFDEAGKSTIRANASGQSICLHGQCLSCGPSHTGSLIIPPTTALHRYQL